MTLASVLNMDYTQSIPQVAEPDSSAVGQARQLTGAINDAYGIRLLRDRGYEIIASGGPFGEGSLMSADTFLEPGGLTKFEEQVARFTWLATVIDYVAPEFMPTAYRESVEGAFANWRRVAQSPPRLPYFMLTHVMAPHTPFLFAADGSPRPPQDCFPAQCSLWETEMQRVRMTLEEYGAGWIPQIKYTNQLILKGVDEVLDLDPNAVIVVFSDHGIRYDRADREEQLRNFLAIRSPRNNSVLLSDTSAVNILPIIFNTYFRTELPIRDYSGWYSGDTPLDVVPISMDR
jgi:hypothetical protein